MHKSIIFTTILKYIKNKITIKIKNIGLFKSKEEKIKDYIKNQTI